MLFEQIKKIIKHSFIYGLGNALSPILSLLIAPIFTRYLTPGDYGILTLLTISGNLLLGIIDFGFSNASMRYYYDYEDKKDQDKALFTGYISIFISSFVIIGLLFITNALLTPKFSSNGIYPIYISIYLGITFLQSINKIPFNLYRIMEKSMTYSIINIITVLLQITISFILVVIYRLNVLGLLISSIATQAIIIAINHYHFFKYIEAKRAIFKLIKPYFKYGAPLSLLLISNWIIDFSDRAVLEKFTNISEVGIYNMGYTFAMGITLVTGGFISVWPIVCMSMRKAKAAPEMYSRLITYYSFTMTIPTLLICFFGKEFFLLLHPDFIKGSTVTPVIAFAYAIRGIYLILLTGFMITKKTKYQIITEIPPMIINVLLMIWWIPKYGIMGAAWSTLIAFALMPIITYIINLKVYPIPLEKSRLTKILITILVLLQLNTYIQAELSLSNILSKATIVLVGFPVMLYILNFYIPEEKVWLRERIQKLISKKSL